MLCLPADLENYLTLDLPSSQLIPLLHSTISPAMEIPSQPTVGASSEHQPNCEFHASPRDGLCAIVTLQGKICNGEATLVTPGFLSRCLNHRGHKRKVGSCQALEHCEFPCNRVVFSNLPRPYCAKHSVPSDLCKLPNELLVQIFEFIFPEVVPNASVSGVDITLLTLNRQLYRIGCEILYGRSQFHAEIDVGGISILGKCWRRPRDWETLSPPLAVHSVLPQRATTRIKNLTVSVYLDASFGTTFDIWNGLPREMEPDEEATLLEVRDSVRKFVSALSSNQIHLKSLKVIPELTTRSHWTHQEISSAVLLVLEPFQLLQVDNPILTLPDFPRIWLQSSDSPQHQKTSLYTRDNRVWQILVKQNSCSVIKSSWEAQRRFTEIENLGQHIQLQREMDEDYRWPIDPSGLREVNRPPLYRTDMMDVERPPLIWAFYDFYSFLRLAREAAENADLELLEVVRDAIARRWITAMRGRRDEVTGISDAIQNMYHAVNLPAPPGLYPEEGIWKDQAHSFVDSLELPPVGNAPALSDPNVTFERLSRARLRIQRGREVWIRLRTPKLERQKMAVEALAAQ